MIKRTAEQMKKSPVLLNERSVSGAITQLPLEIVSQHFGIVKTYRIEIITAKTKIIIFYLKNNGKNN